MSRDNGRHNNDDDHFRSKEKEEDGLSSSSWPQKQSSSASSSSSSSSLLQKLNDPTHLSTLPSSVLESRFQQLRSQSNTLSQQVTQKLASSSDGQHLLHIGSSLATLPPDLTVLLENIAPLLNDVGEYEQSCLQELDKLVAAGKDIQTARRRGLFAMECGMILEDLLSAEEHVRRDLEWRLSGTAGAAAGGGTITAKRMLGGGGGGLLSARNSDDATGGGSSAIAALLLADDDDDGLFDELDHVASLERAAHTTLHLVQELRSSTAEIQSITTSATSSSPNKHHNVSSSGSKRTSSYSSSFSEGTAPSKNDVPSMRTPLPNDTEKAQFLMKLAPRIRKLESDTIKSLTLRLESILTNMKRRKMEEDESAGGGGGAGDGYAENNQAIDRDWQDEERELLMIGHCLRGLALLGRGKEAESAFARVAIMPIIRSKVSMGRLDEGGSRGECAGLFSLLDDIAFNIDKTFGSVLRLSEGIFDMTPPRPRSGDGKEATSEFLLRQNTEVDLVTAGVWVPVATALMADPAIKMAIFSPGIATILQANYTALDTFLSELAFSLLKESSEHRSTSTSADADSQGGFESLYFKTAISAETIRYAQDRIYRHPMTAEFYKKWNLPIYYQLRFGECCGRLNKAIGCVQKDGWNVDVFTGTDSVGHLLRNNQGFELPLFMELYDILLSLWRPDVILRPLAHRFLRGAVQLMVRTIAFVKDGLEGRIKFGKDNYSLNSSTPVENGSSSGINGDASSGVAAEYGGSSYCWGERLEDVAAVAWELTILESCMSSDYLDTIVEAVAPQESPARDEILKLASDVLAESSEDIAPIIRESWDKIIVGILTDKCCAPLSAVKGVAATYRMTNRPPPTQASPFVSTILRPLKEFDDNFASRTPPQVGSGWKNTIVNTVSERYSVAVEELIVTVERTEVALKNRKTRRAAAAGMSDGEKVKLQLFLDYKEYAHCVDDVGVNAMSVDGIMKLETLTKEAESLYQQSRNGKLSSR